VIQAARIGSLASEQSKSEANMSRPRKSATKLAEPLASRRLIPLAEAAALINVHEDTFEDHYGHLVVRIGPRLKRVPLQDVLAIGSKR
jgi:hypothetical protein